MQTDLVIVSEYCQKCHIDPSFIILLEEGGLIDINITDGERYLFSSQLRDLEQYTRMYYDLSITSRESRPFIICWTGCGICRRRYNR